MSGYVSPYGTASSADAPASTYKSPYAAETPAPAKTTYQSPYATGAFADPKHKPAVDTSGLDRSIASQDAQIRKGLETVAKPVAGAFELMNRPTQAAYAKHAGRGYWDAIVHGVEPGQAQMDAAKAYSDFGKLPASAPLTDPVGQGALDTLVNPLSLLGMPIKGLSTAARIGNAVEGHGFAAAVKGADKVAGLVKKAPGGEQIANAAAGVHDFMGVHSAAKRELARLHGAQWLDKYAQYRADLMRYGGMSPEDSLEADLRKHLMEVSPEQRAGYEKALTRGGEGLPFASQISPKGKTVPPPSVETGTPSQIGFGLAADTPKPDVPRQAFGPTKDALNQMIYRRGPEAVAQHAATLKGPEREAFLQGNRKYEAFGQFEPAPSVPERPAVEVKPGPENLGMGEVGEQGELFQKPPVSVSPTTKKPLLGETGPLQTLRAHAATADVAKRLGGLTDEDRKIFGLMTDSTKGYGAKGNLALDIASIPSDLLTAGMFAQPLGHMANIGGLGAFAAPGAVVDALAHGTVDNAKKLVGAVTRGAFGGGETNEAIAARHAGAQRGGAIPSHATERYNILIQGLDKAAETAGKVPLAGKALALVPKAVAGLYRASGDILWKFDDEVKARRFQTLVDGGMSPARAGLRVGGELVDYENKSPAAKMLRPFAPFSTWRTKAPLAVARNAIENPGRTQLLTSTAPAIMGGRQGADPDTGKPYKASLPGAEFNELTSGLQGAASYGTGTIGSVPRIVGDLAAAAFAMREPDTPRGRAAQKKARTQFTYGQEPGTFLLNELPIVQQIMQYGPAGMFNKGQAPSNLNDLLSLIRVRPGQ